MVDLTKHHARIEKAIRSCSYAMAIEVVLQCQEIEPTNVKNYKLLIEAAKRQAQTAKKSMFGGLSVSFSKDPHKKLSGAIKKVSKTPDLKSLLAAGDAAIALVELGTVKMLPVAILLYESAKAEGLFNAELLWNLGHAYHKEYELKKDKNPKDLDKALRAIAELKSGMPSHKDATRTLKNWEALKSINTRPGEGDFTSQLASDDSTKRNELMGRIVRTEADAKEILAFVNDDLIESPEDKTLWVKKGDVLRRVSKFDEAVDAYKKAIEIDKHDFALVMKVGDIKIAKIKDQIKSKKEKGENIDELKKELLSTEITEYEARCQRQPTEMSHRFNLGVRLLKSNKIDEAAASFQKAVIDPRFKQQIHKYMGQCFIKKKLYELALDQYNSYIENAVDFQDEEVKGVLYNRARLSEQLGKTDDAATDYKKIIEIDLSYKDAANRLNELRK